MGIFKPPYGARLKRGHPLARGLVGCWLMNEGSGDKIYDLSGNRNNGVFVASPVWVNSGIDFERGDSDRIDISNPAGLGFGTNNYTIIAKIKVESFSANNGIIGFGTYDPGWLINGTELGIYDGGFKTKSSKTLNSSIEYTVAWVREGVGADQVKYYVDDVAAGTSTHGDSIPVPTTVGIGDLRGGAANEPFDGIIYYVYFYNRALTPSENQALHINPYAMFEDPYPIELFGYVAAGITVNCTSGAITIVGINPNLSVGTDIDSTLGEINIAGLNPSISVGIGIDATLGQINIIGLGVAISEGIDIDSTLGEVNIAGLNTDVQTGIVIDVILGQINIDKFNADISVGTNIDSLLGSVNIAGLNADIDLGIVIEPNTGAIAVAGQNTAVEAETTIDSTLGQINIAGLNPNISLPTNVDCTKGDISISSLNPDIVSTVLVDVELGLINVDGLAVNIQIGELVSSPAKRTLMIEQENRTLMIEAENRICAIEAENRTLII